MLIYKSSITTWPNNQSFLLVDTILTILRLVFSLQRHKNTVSNPGLLVVINTQIKCFSSTILTHDLPPPTSKVFRSIFADDLKYFVAGPNLSTITTKLQQSMDELAVYANQWRIWLNAGKTSKLLFQRSTRYLPDWHITLHGKAICSVTAKFLGITFDTTLSFTNHFHAITNLARHRLLKLLSISTHGPSPSTTIRLFKIYIRTLLELR